MLKKDWPAKWPAFIPELVGASKTSENLCENSMHILRLLSEEVFDFNRGAMTQAKTRILKAQLNNEFQSIHELCHFVLSSVGLWTSRPSLIKATLSALQVRRRAGAPLFAHPLPPRSIPARSSAGAAGFQNITWPRVLHVVPRRPLPTVAECPHVVGMLLP